MTLPIAYRRGVSRDLAAAYDWYEEQRPGLGEEFLFAVENAFKTVQLYPEMFAAVHGNVRRTVVSRFPYAVFYLVESERVVILTVLHTARNPDLWPRYKREAR